MAPKKKKAAKKVARVRKPKARVALSSGSTPGPQYKEDPSIVDRLHNMEEGSVIEKHAQGFYARPVVQGQRQHGFGKTISEAFADIGSISTPE